MSIERRRCKEIAKNKTGQERLSEKENISDRTKDIDRSNSSHTENEGAQSGD